MHAHARFVVPEDIFSELPLETFYSVLCCCKLTVNGKDESTDPLRDFYSTFYGS